MGAAGDLGTDKGGFGVEHIGVDPLQVVAALVVVAVAGGGGEVGGVDLISLHGGQNLALVVLRRLVNLIKAGTQAFQNRFPVFIHSPADAKLFVHLLNFHDFHPFLRISHTNADYNRQVRKWQAKSPAEVKILQSVEKTATM